MKYMPHSKPRKSLELQILSFLNARMDLSSRDQKNLYNLERGYEGELKFSRLLGSKDPSECLRLYDLQLEINQTEFQIDNLLIYQDTVYMNEIKNYEGDFLAKDDKWYVMPSEKEIRSPILQLQRSEFLLQQLLQQMGFHLKIVSRLVFVHSGFTLYQAPYNQPIIFPTQLARYTNHLNHTQTRLTDMHRKLAKQLVQSNISSSRHMRLPNYNYEDLKKGIVCNNCSGFMFAKSMSILCCESCMHEERIDFAVMRTVSEFHILFPNMKINSSTIYEWCNVIDSKSKIRRILMKNMQLVKRGKYSYYIFKK